MEERPTRVKSKSELPRWVVPCAVYAVGVMALTTFPPVNVQGAVNIYDRTQPRVIVGRDYLSHEPLPAHTQVDDRARMTAGNSLLAPDTILSPGILIDYTSYDSWANDSQGHQVGRNPGAAFVHFTWINWDIIPGGASDLDRFVNYAAWDVSGGVLFPEFGGTEIGLGDFSRAGFARLDVDSDSRAHVAFHQYPDPGIQHYAIWHLFLPYNGSDIIFPEMLPTISSPWYFTEYLWPDIAIAQDAVAAKSEANDVYHVISTGAIPAAAGFASPTGDIVYWRKAQNEPDWYVPVVIDSSNGALSYVIDAADGTDKVGVAFTQNYEGRWNNLFNLVYRESYTAGIGWRDGSELGNASRQYVTDYTDNDTPGPQVWAHISIAYDHAGILHIVWDEQRFANQSPDIAIKHWNDLRRDIRTAAVGYYDNDANYSGHLNLNKVTLGVGDGAAYCSGIDLTTEDFLYVVFTKNCGETPQEQADYSKFGVCNGELYTTGSTDGGRTWAPPVNLTNTKTPQCTSIHPDSLCASETMATIARDISGQAGIDILYLLDFEAASWADGSGWTLNPVMYLNLPGGDDAPFVCPLVASAIFPELAVDPECQFHAAAGAFQETQLRIANTGSATLNGTIAITEGSSWLSIAPSGAFSVTTADEYIDLTVTMDAIALMTGFYDGTIEIAHNGFAQPNPIVIPIEFAVTPYVFCPEEAFIKTADAGNGVLTLQISSGGRFGAPHDDGGLQRWPDLSRAIGDASLLVAHGDQMPDTLVFHRFGNKQSDPGQHGFAAITPLDLDTSRYGTGAGYAVAEARFMTMDAALGIDAHWYTPQHPDSADFVIAEYVVTNRTDQDGMLPQTIDDIVLGLWIDFNVTEAPPVDYQMNVDNEGAYWPDSNLLYQFGADAPGWNPPSHFQTSRRYSAGVTYMAGRDASGQEFSFASVPLHGAVRDNRENQIGGGPGSGFMYSQLTGAAGVSVVSMHPDSSKDIYTVLTLDQGLTLDPGETQYYIVGFVSDTLQHFAYGPAPGQMPAAGLHRIVQAAWQWAEHNVACGCPAHGDPVVNGVVDVLDVVKAVDVAFRNGASSIGPKCPFEDTDVSCNGATDVFDVVRFVDVAFRNADPVSAFCAPCAL